VPEVLFLAASVHLAVRTKSLKTAGQKLMFLGRNMSRGESGWKLVIFDHDLRLESIFAFFSI